MRNLPLGGTGLSVSAIGLGCMGMSEFYGARDDARSLETLATALDHGINFFDTADMYGAGHNEELLARFLSGKREGIVVATKFGIVRKADVYERRIDNSPAYVAAACDASLKRLGIDCIDLYYAHRRNPDTPIEDTVGAMADLVKAGKVRTIGLSEVSEETLRRAAAVHPIAALQSEYSLWTRDAETGILAACRELGTLFVAYSPLGRAFLTGTISPDTLPENDFRRQLPRFSDAAFARNAVLTESLAAFAAERDATASQIALAWMLNKHPHVVPIPGTKRPGYVIENAEAARITLSPAEIARLDALFPPDVAGAPRYTPEGMKGVGI